MNATEGLTVLGENTTNMIISNLQGQFIAELLRAVHEAEHGDIVHLMQQAVSVGPGSFAKVLVQLQADLEKMGKERSRKAARDMARLLDNLGNVDIGKRTMDRKSRLGGSAGSVQQGGVAVADKASCEEKEFEWEPDWL